ncbi:hypothetical protein TrVFT333_011545 [Trichoderma virens FT-333]|nr:hypothetical protein TrVFT333_011545 [Trichoderma virens FT-333]
MKTSWWARVNGKIKGAFSAHPGLQLTHWLPGVCGIAYAPRLTIWARVLGRLLVPDNASIITIIIMGVPGLVISIAPSCLYCQMKPLYGVRASKHKTKFGSTNGFAAAGIAAGHVSDVACLAGTCLLALARR